MKRQKHVFKRAFACVMVVVMALTAVPLSGFVGLELPKWSELFSTKASAASTGRYKYSVSNGEATITRCDVLIEGDVVLPDTLGGYPVTRINAYAFEDCTGLTSITIPDSVTSIGSRAFYWCTGLTSITIPDGVTSIDDGAFYYCTGLTSITIPDGVTRIHDSTFYYCTGLTSITIPDSVTSIGDWAFINCTGLIIITIPDSVASIGSGAFYGCTGLTNITIPNSVTKIFPSAFSGCTDLTSITLPDSVTSIRSWTFKDCIGLTSITIPDSVTSIEGNAFKSCTGLTSITIPDSVTSIGDSAFGDCTSIKDVYYSGTESQWREDISIGSENMYLTDATVHYDSVGNGSSDNTDSNSSTNQSLAIDCLRIKAYSRDGQNLVGSAIKTATVDWGSDSASTAQNRTGVYVPKNEINGSILITEEYHRDYIIPEGVALAFKELKSAVSFPVYMAKKNKESCYISSVIGKKDNQGASKFVDLKHSSIECIEGEKATIYVASCGLSNPTYFIAQGYDLILQDYRKKISSTTGEFSAVDIHNEFDFNGDIVVYAEGSDGKKTQPVKIKLVKKIKLSQAVQDFSKKKSINLIGSNGMSVEIGKENDLLGGATIDFSAFQVPIGIEINGTDVKISLGFDFFESNKNNGTGEWEKKWKGFKDNCKSVEQVVDELDDTYKNWQKKWNSLENLKKQYSGKNVIKTGAADKNKGWTCSFLGYIEGSLNKYGKICFKEGSIMASAEFNFKYSQQTAIWSIPAYYYFELGAEVTIDGKVYRLVPDRGCPVDWDATLNVTPKIAAGGGVGISGFVSAGLRGEGSVPIKLEFTSGHLTIDLDGGIYAEAQLLFCKCKIKIFEGSKNILDKNLWEARRAKRILSLKQEDPLYDNSDTEPVVTMVDRDYADNTSPWLGSSSGVRKAPARAATSGGIRFTNLQTSVYNQSQAQVVTVGGKQIMVFVADDSTRDDYNRLCLMYSVNENGTWSTPEAVYSDGKNDASPSLATDGKKVYVSWQKVAKKLTKKDCESEQVMLENMEIYLAEFNNVTGSFKTAKRITENSVCDYLPFTVVENEKVSVYFAEGNPDKPTNKIVRYTKTDEETKTLETLKDSLPYISALSAVSNEVSYCIDKDTKNGSTNDMTVFTIKDGIASEFKKYVSEDADTSQNAYSLLTYGKMDGEQTLFVSDGSSIYYQQKDDQQNVETKKAFSTVSSIIGCLQAVNTDEGLTLLWVGYADDATEIFSCSYKNGAWGEPVRISSQGNVISFLSANNIGGTISGVCNITESEFDESKDDYVDKTNLTSFAIGDYTDLSVSAFAPDETQMKPGTETHINCYVTQKGTEDITALDVIVTDTLDTEIVFQEEVELKSGSTINLDIPYTVPWNYQGTTITVQVEAAQADDKNLDDNEAVIETGKKSIILNDKPIEEFDDVYILPISVENHTVLNIENLTLTYSIEDYNEDKKMKVLRWI